MRIYAASQDLSGTGFPDDVRFRHAQQTYVLEKMSTMVVKTSLCTWPLRLIWCTLMVNVCCKMAEVPDWYGECLRAAGDVQYLCGGLLAYMLAFLAQPEHVRSTLTDKPVLITVVLCNVGIPMKSRGVERATC